jgi:hypothetical protein
MDDTPINRCSTSNCRAARYFDAFPFGSLLLLEFQGQSFKSRVAQMVGETYDWAIALGRISMKHHMTQAVGLYLHCL